MSRVREMWERVTVGSSRGALVWVVTTDFLSVCYQVSNIIKPRLTPFHFPITWFVTAD